jgi:PAS domain S-box-containing protein
MGVSSHISLSKIKKSTDIVAKYAQKMKEISKLRFPLLEALIVNDYLVSGDVRKKSHFEAVSRVVEETMRDVESMTFSEEENNLLMEIKEHFAVVIEKSEEIMQFADVTKKDFIDPRSNKIIEEIDEAAAIVVENIEGLDELIKRNLEEQIKKSDRIKSVGNLTIIITSSLAVVIGVIAWLVLTRSITAPVRSLISSTKIMARGDLTLRTEIKSNDEIGELANSFSKMAEDLQKITVSRDYVDNIIKTMADALIVTDSDRKIRTINPVTAKLLGYKEDELIGMPVDAIIAQEELQFKREGTTVDLIEKGSISNIDKSLVTKDGRKIPVLFSANVMHDNKSKIQGMVYMALDITERKRAEEQIQKLSHAIEQSPTTVVITDIDGNIEYVNPMFTQLTGYLYEEAIGKNPRILKSGKTSPEKYKSLWGKITSGREWRGEFCNKKKNGELYWEFMSISPVKNSEGVITNYIAVKEDITQRKLTEERLITYKEKLQSLSSELSLAEERERRSIATELHDNIGQILATTIIKLKMLRESKSSVDHNGILDEINKLLDKTMQSIRLLTYELSPPILYELGFEPAVEWLVEQYRKNYDMIIDIVRDEQSKPMENDMRTLLFKAVRELLVNVLRHAKAHNTKISIRRDRDNIRVEVEDDGVGFNASELHSSVNKVSGFGLFNLGERIKYIGGYFGVISEPGHGTRITLVAPLKC